MSDQSDILCFHSGMLYQVFCNVTAVRAETSATNNLIHFNNAGASLMPDIVVDGIKNYLDCEALMGGYEAADKFSKEINSFYDHVAILINASAQEIAFAESATVAWQRAIHSIPFEKDDVILTCVNEYASNYIAYLQLAKFRGVLIKVIPNDNTGAIDINALEKEINDKVKLISICHISTGNGLINPAEEVGGISKKHNILYMLDACQSVGQYPVDVDKIKCDFLSVTGRKYLRGPRGTGFLYARQSTTRELEPTFLDLHGAEWVSQESYQMRNDAKKYETWEANLSSKLGLSIAINYLNQLGIQKVYESVISLASYFRDCLNEISGIQVQDTGIYQSGIVTFTSESANPNNIKSYLSQNNVNVSIIVASSSLLDLEERKISEVVRASVHYYNTQEEIDQTIRLIRVI